MKPEGKVEAKPGDDPETSGVSVGGALLTYCGLFLLALLATDPNPRALAFAWLFPVGLGMAFRSLGTGTGWVAPILSYVVYLWLLLGLLATRRNPGAFLTVAGLLALCLLLNVSGCRSMAASFGH